MTTDILLVLGSVTSDEYQTLRAAMIRKGLDPEIVRVSEEQVLRFYDREATDIGILHYDTDNNRPELGVHAHNRALGVRLWVQFDEQLRIKQSDVKALLSSEQVLGEVHDNLVAALRRKIPAYKVCHPMIKETRRFERALQGSGYGPILRISK